MHDHNQNTHQTLYIVRHGTAYHNIPKILNGVPNHPNLKDPQYTDSSLIAQGQEQARNEGKYLFRALANHNETLTTVISSPLTS